MKRTTKSALAIALTTALCLSGTTVDIAKAKAPKLSKTKTNVNVGKTVKITVKGAKVKKTKWTVKSGKGNVTLSSKKKTSVVIKGKKAGKAVVSAKITVGKKNYTKKVTVTVKAAKASTNNATATPSATPVVTPTATPVATATSTPAPTATATAEPTPTPAGDEVAVNITDINNDKVFIEDENGQADGIVTKVEDGVVVSEIGQYTGIIYFNPDATAAAKCNAVKVEYACDAAFDFYGFTSELEDGLGQTPAGQSSPHTVKSTDGKFVTATFTQADFDMDADGMFALKIVNMNSKAAIKIKSITFCKA